jgi:hypothetical protein
MWITFILFAEFVAPGMNLTEYGHRRQNLRDRYLSERKTILIFGRHKMRAAFKGAAFGGAVIFFGSFISDPAASALWLMVSGLLVSIGVAI